MKELKHIQFFQLRPKIRVSISKTVKKCYQKRESNSETLAEKQSRIKSIAQKINQNL